MLRHWSVQPTLFGRQVLGLDELSAPLVPSIALAPLPGRHGHVANQMRRFSFSWSLAAEAIRLATFSCKEPWSLIGLLSISTVPPFVELLHRGRPTRLYVIHMSLFIGLLVLGWAIVGSAIPSKAPAAWWATLPLLAAILIRCGTVPAHCWLTDWFEHASLRDRLALRRASHRCLRRRPTPHADRA